MLPCFDATITDEGCVEQGRKAELPTMTFGKSDRDREGPGAVLGRHALAIASVRAFLGPQVFDQDCGEVGRDPSAIRDQAVLHLTVRKWQAECDRIENVARERACQIPAAMMGYSVPSEPGKRATAYSATSQKRASGSRSPSNLPVPPWRLFLPAFSFRRFHFG